MERFADQMREELNVKEVTLHDPEWGPLLTQEVKPNMKTLGPKFGARLKEVVAAIAGARTDEMAAKMRQGGSLELACGGETVLLEPADLMVSMKASEGCVGMADGETQIVLDARITEELADEGVAREIVRHVQNLRREANLEMEDRIVLYLGTELEKLHACDREVPRLHGGRNADGQMVGTTDHWYGHPQNHGQSGRPTADD